ncbi:MAG: ECF transporter S component [Clostridiales bacterium]|nr:ECF transporter S component [Clostridiales bacterium]
MKLTTRKLAIIGMLGGISIILGITPLGFIPIGPVKATIMHIPVIIGSIVEGPLVGLFIGLIFGGFSMFQAYVMPTSPVQVVFMDPVVAVLPRLLIALVTHYSYRGIRRTFARDNQKRGRILGTMIGAALGTITNTGGVLGAIYLRHAAVYAEKLGIDPSVVGNTILYGIAIPNGIPEIIIAVLVVTAVVRALQKFYRQEL